MCVLHPCVCDGEIDKVCKDPKRHLFQGMGSWDWRRREERNTTGKIKTSTRSRKEEERRQGERTFQERVLGEGKRRDRERRKESKPERDRDGHIRSERRRLFFSFRRLLIPAFEGDSSFTLEWLDILDEFCWLKWVGTWRASPPWEAKVALQPPTTHY